MGPEAKSNLEDGKEQYEAPSAARVEISWKRDKQLEKTENRGQSKEAKK